jgi:hypothetical protein
MGKQCLGNEGRNSGRMLRRRWIVAVAVTASLLVLAGLSYVVVRVVSVAVRAERALHAVYFATVLVQEHVEATGEWPRCWEDLEACSVSSFAMYKWPDDSNVMQEYVYIDFDATLEDVATQDYHQFRAIRPVGPVFEGYEAYFPALIATVRRVLDSRRSGLYTKPKSREEVERRR